MVLKIEYKAKMILRSIAPSHGMKRLKQHGPDMLFSSQLDIILNLGLILYESVLT